MAQQQLAPVQQAWEAWEGRVVGGKFALGRYIAGNAHSAVYETDFGGVTAAVKMVEGGSHEGQAQLGRWDLVRKLDHPHLMRVFETGFWHANEEQDMLFAVMEYGDENLAEVLLDRPLSQDEVRGMLGPILDLLSFLHGRDLVYGCVKPSNVFAVGNQVKLAGDSVRHVSDRQRFGVNDPYAAPHCASEGFSPRTDLWSVGMTLVEALTGHPPEVDTSQAVKQLPGPFATIVSACLQKDSAKAPSVAQIREMLVVPPPGATKLGSVQSVIPPAPKSAVAGAMDTKTPEATSNEPQGTEEADKSNKLAILNSSAESDAAQRALWQRFLIGGVFLALLLSAIVIGLRHRSETPTPVMQKVPPASEVAATNRAQPPAVEPGSLSQRSSVLRQVMPEVSHVARNSIHGTVRIGVLAEVNAAGQVSDAKLKARNSSRYFERQALEAARHWMFVAPIAGGKPVPSRWSLKFEFRRSGDKVSAQMLDPKS